MKQLIDIYQPGIDLIFRENYRLDTFTWNSNDAGIEETNAHALRAAATLAQLWQPERWHAELSAFELEIPFGQGRHIAVDATPEDAMGLLADAIQAQASALATPAQPWGLRHIATSHQGWVRLALPHGVAPSAAWCIVDPDGIIRPEYAWQLAQPTEASDSIWLHLPGVNTANHMALMVEAAGDIQISIRLGLTFFAPENDPRAPDQHIQGSTLAAWQQANLRMLRSIIDTLAQDGWEHSAPESA